MTQPPNYPQQPGQGVGGSHPNAGQLQPGQQYGSAPNPAFGSAPSPQYSQPVGVSTVAPPRANFFDALMDFRFDHFITVQFASVLYVICWIQAFLFWGSLILLGFLFGELGGGLTLSSRSSFNPVFLLLALFLGWIPSFFFLVYSRLFLEFFVSIIRTAENTGALVTSKAI